MGWGGDMKKLYALLCISEQFGPNLSKQDRIYQNNKYEHLYLLGGILIILIQSKTISSCTHHFFHMKTPKQD